MTVIFYFNIYDNPFQYDDIHSIVENSHIRSLTNIPLFFTDPTLFSEDPKSAMYRPLVLMSYALNYAISEYQTGSYHWFNLLVHIGNSLLVCALLRHLGGNQTQAFWGGLLFGLHPVNSEVVNYISSRSESLCALFFLLSLICYIKGRMGGGRESRWIGASLFAFAGALLSKAVGITLLGVLLAYEGFFRGIGEKRDLFRIARCQWPFWTLGGIYLFSTRQMIGTALFEHPVRDFSTQALTQVKALAYYVKLLVVPVGLNVEHQFELADGLGEMVVLLSLGLFVSAVWMALGLRVEYRQKLFWLAWPIIILAPTLIVPLNVLVNEHRLYLSAVAFAALGGTVLGGVNGRRSRGLLIAGGAVLLIYGALAHQRTAVWQSRESLWGDALTRSPLMPRPHIYMGDHYKVQGRHEQALEEYRQALRVNPKILTGGDQLIVYNNMGATYLSMGHFVEAVESYQRALRIDSTYTRARDSLEGLLALRDTERDPEAEKLRKLGLSLMIAGRLDDAIVCLNQSLERQNDPQTWMGLGMVYERKEDWEGALRTYRILKQVGQGTRYAETAEQKIGVLQDRL